MLQAKGLWSKVCRAAGVFRLAPPRKLDNMLTNEPEPSRRTKGEDVDEDEDDLPGAAVCRRRDARFGAGKKFRLEDFDLGAGHASAAEIAGRLGRRGREGFRRHDQVEGVSGSAARQGVRPL